MYRPTTARRLGTDYSGEPLPMPTPAEMRRRLTAKPKPAPNTLPKLFWEAMYKSITIVENGKRRRVTKLDVQSRHLLERVKGESVRLCCPGLADEFVGGEAFEGLEPPGEVVGGNEVCQMAAELVVGFIMETPDRGFLDRSVHAFDLTIIRHDGRRRFHTLPIVGDMVRPSGLWGAGSTGVRAGRR